MRRSISDVHAALVDAANDLLLDIQAQPADVMGDYQLCRCEHHERDHNKDGACALAFSCGCEHFLSYGYHKYTMEEVEE